MNSDELIKRLAKIGEKEYLGWSWAGSLICFWCGVVDPTGWDAHDDDCPQLEAWRRFGGFAAFAHPYGGEVTDVASTARVALAPGEPPGGVCFVPAPTPREENGCGEDVDNL